MAKYVPSALIGRISRSSGATTFAHNRFGAYFRNRVIPTNPATAKQAAVRDSLTNASQAWRALSDAQRAAWTSLGASIVRTDTLGQVYTLTGQQTYMLCNRNLFTVGSAALSTAPALAPPASLASVTPTLTV